VRLFAWPYNRKLPWVTYWPGGTKPRYEL